jgi:DDE superfamily endonuclease
LGGASLRRVIIPDGTLIPTRNRAAHRELYSGKRHQSGAAVQILSGTDGQLRHVGEPIAGSIHDVRAFRETGLADVLAEHMDNNLVIADQGYRGEPVITPVRKPPKGELSPAQVDANKYLSGIRSAVERCIAHLKNWKILATGYRRPLRKLAVCLAAVTALEFYRLNWASSE